jgi:hypothetical protein
MKKYFNLYATLTIECSQLQIQAEDEDEAIEIFKEQINQQLDLDVSGGIVSEHNYDYVDVFELDEGDIDLDFCEFDDDED